MRRNCRAGRGNDGYRRENRGRNRPRNLHRMSIFLPIVFLRACPEPVEGFSAFSARDFFAYLFLKFTTSCWSNDHYPAIKNPLPAGAGKIEDGPSSIASAPQAAGNNRIAPSLKVLIWRSMEMESRVIENVKLHFFMPGPAPAGGLLWPRPQSNQNSFLPLTLCHAVLEA
jgi:hypothetical protein